MAYTYVQSVNGTIAGGNLGKTVCIDGYYVVVGENSGNAYLFKRNIEGEWQANTISPIGTTSSFGDSISIYQDVIIIGDPDYNSTGRIYIIERDDVSSYITIDGSDAGDRFGCSVSVTDQYLVVGASGANDNKGEVYVYEKTDSGAWNSYSGNPISPLISVSNDYFGQSVGVNNSCIIVGSPGDNNKTGAIYVFEIDSDGIWQQTQKILASDGSYNDEFGNSVYVYNDYFCAGARYKESLTNEINAGSVYLFKYSSTWYEIDRLYGIGENSYHGNHFGNSVCMDNNYIIVGSPNARNKGVADIFYRIRSWGHLKKIVYDDSGNEDNFGYAVSISGRFVVVGAPENDDGAIGGGSIYFYENPPVRLRLAQEFEVNQTFLPSKASVYFKRKGQNLGSAWLCYDSVPTIIDASNFSTISRDEKNIVIFDDQLGSFTGNGYMVLMDNTFSSYQIVNFPIQAFSPGTFNVWLRCLSQNSSVFNADLLIDGVVSKTISEEVLDPSVLEWTWINTKIILPDVNEHILGIRMKEKGAVLDKIYIDSSSTVPYSEGAENTTSPYLTVHMKVYSSEGEEPCNPLYIYDYKNSLTELKQDDWYNFDIKSLDNLHGYINAFDFYGNYFLVVSCSGSNPDNYIVWEMMDNDEYSYSPSAFKF